jgi:hypothetical protein
MNIPLDNLYHWIRGCASEPLSIYTFQPHGSKNINDLNFLSPEDLSIVSPEIVCHDQEPLDYAMHKDVNILELWLNSRKGRDILFGQEKIMNEIVPQYRHLNFYTMLRALKFRTIFDRYILLHSEKNSIDVEKFSQTAEPVYYWSHGIIARDWYRFAEHDPRFDQIPTTKKTFLVYCRAWTGTREYRLKFLDLLAQKYLLEDCQTAILHQDQDIDLSSYMCNDKNLQPTHVKESIKKWKSLNPNDTIKNQRHMLARGEIAELPWMALTESLPNNNQHSYASADYSVDDILSTDISVILETVAAESKIHLTEKTLRPIACGHPFMLVAGPGSLEYLRSYGFKTFSPWINESYDSEPDIIKRMQLIVDEMVKISKLSLDQKENLLCHLKEIATFNKNHFFSKKFFNKIQTELVENLKSAIDKVKATQGKNYLSLIPLIKQYKTPQEDKTKPRNVEVAKSLRALRHNSKISIKNIVSRFPKGFFNA